MEPKCNLNVTSEASHFSLLWNRSTLNTDSESGAPALSESVFIFGRFFGDADEKLLERTEDQAKTEAQTVPERAACSRKYPFSPSLHL